MRPVTRHENRASSPTLWQTVWEWVARPSHFKAVHGFSAAAQSGDEALLGALLDPEVAVVVEAGEAAHPTIKVVKGVYEAVALLRHGMAPRPGVIVAERPVGSQAGLVLSRGGEPTASVTVDFTGRLVSVVWIKLHATA
jgi:RNA polymerase sigma-70 factor (ECF subfamily)